MMTRLSVKAPSKINLGLWVGRRRPDGYHEIVTVIVPLEFGDEVELRRTAAGIELMADSPAVPEGPDNLAWRAAEHFFAASGLRAGCRIRIRKRIPVGSGLGGGSSDAAATLSGLNRLFGSPLTGPELRSLAAMVGSDVPALLFGAPSVARGRGERLRPIRLPQLHVLLHFPGYPIATRWAYSALDRSRRPGSLTEPVLSPKILTARLRQGESGHGVRCLRSAALRRAARLVRNSFEPVVFRRHPGLARVRRLMLDAGCYAAALSGSGSTVYGLMEKGRQDPMAALKRQGISCTRTRSIKAKYEVRMSKYE